jgi:hypothetical protein
LADDSQNFWEKKPDSLDELIQNRKIPVSVKATSENDKKHHLHMQGIGEVNAPYEYTKKWTMHFEHLKRVSDFAREVKWNPITRTLFFHTEAFGYHARMHLKVDKELNFEVVRGVFTGMKGQIKVHKRVFAKSLVSISTHYDYSQWNIPKLFLEFGLEVVLQKFAERLRSLIEKDFKEGRPAQPKLAKSK